jgi:hypothetical protein
MSAQAATLREEVGKFKLKAEQKEDMELSSFALSSKKHIQSVFKAEARVFAFSTDRRRAPVSYRLMLVAEMPEAFASSHCVICWAHRLVFRMLTGNHPPSHTGTVL